MNMHRVPQEGRGKSKKNFLRTIILRLWPLPFALVLTLFPFDWLGNVWPAYRQVFDQVFVGAREHHIGHSTLFFIVGLLILICFSALRSRPLLYFGLMISGALAQEAVQNLFKLHLPGQADGLDLFFDAIGFIAAYLVVWGWQSILKWKKV